MTLQEKYEKQKEINKELVDENEALKFAARMSEKVEKQLREENKDLADCNSRLLSQAAAATKRVIQQEKENADLKTDKQYWEQKANRLTTEWGETLDQLAQAKKIINNLLELELLPETKEVKQAEQFLNGNGCPDVLCEDCTKEDCTVRKLGLVEKKNKKICYFTFKAETKIRR